MLNFAVNMSSPIYIRQIRKQFGKTVAVNHVDLEIEAGSLFFLLGPSGCGKTTLLRMIAGFYEPTAGSIHFGDKEVTHVPANKRNCGMMFQSYALWPHMTVRQNVAFGLKVRKIEAKERDRRVDEALAQVQMSDYANRKPNQLSGGQQQRVALARAMVIEPTVLLLDEPLSNLDAKLRLEMRTQIRDICHAAKITTVYVTHDQKEALSIADGMAVLKDGDVIQAGEPRRLYDRPCNRFVANFLGETNFIPAQIIGREDGAVVLDSPLGKLHSTTYTDNLPQTGNVTCSIRPETITVATGEPNSAFANRFQAKQQQTIYLGELAQHLMGVSDDLAIKRFELNPRTPRPAGTDMKLQVASQDVVILSD
tara:strand:+ start:201 stop:1298 length:1098 start_codon:yes stop_codon:yes gene_type:complete